MSIASLAQAEDRAVSISRFDAPFDSGKLIYAYPAVSVESSAWSSSFASAPAPRTMPTAISVQSSVWSSSFTPPPEPEPVVLSLPPKRTARERPQVEAEPEVEAPAPARKRSSKPRKRSETVTVTPKPKFRSAPILRERAEPAPEMDKTIVEKEILPPAPAPSMVQITGTAGYYSHYMFRGLDVGYRTGIDQSNSSAFFGTSGAVSIENFAVGFWYMNSIDSYVPGGAGFDGSFGDPDDDLDYKSPSRDRYQEYDLFANYTFRLTKDLSLTAGMNFYWFSNGRFWAQGDDHVNNTMEAAASLNWTGIPYVNQTVSYYYDFDAFKGGYLEYKAAMRPLEIYKNGNFAIGLSPNLSLSYDFRYNGTNNGWNNVEPGLDVPIRIADGLSLNFGVRYSLDLGDSSSGVRGAAVDRTDDRLWFSATFQYTFPTADSSPDNSIVQTDAKGLLPILAYGGGDAGRWRVSAGAGLRSIHSTFDVRSARPVNIGSLYQRKSGGGDLGLANDNRDVHYLDGSVFGTDNFGDGTSEFTVQNQSQVLTDGRHGDGGINRQITYNSERYNYSETIDRDGFSATDDDQIVSPYINLGYDIFRGERIGVGIGVGYAFNHSSMNSGTQLASVQSAVENKDAYGFIYNIDELFSPNEPFATPFDSRGTTYFLIYDGFQFDANYGTGIGDPDLSQLHPQQTLLSTSEALATVAAFRSAVLDVDLHSISIPIDLSVNLTNRIQARLSFGPTFNLFDTELTTETYYQLLDPAPVRVRKNDTGRVVYQSPYDSGGGGGGGGGGRRQANRPPTPTTISASDGSSPAGASGGKGSSDGRSRDLPGKNLARQTNHDSGQHFELGAFGQLTVQLDLDAAKRWFVEVYARYDYVPKFTISDGATSSVIDASSWGSGIGIGFRF